MSEAGLPGVGVETIDLTLDRLTNYEVFYKSEQVDVYDGNYQGLMKAFAVPPDLAPESREREGKELLGGMLQTKEVPQALLVLLPSDSKLLLVHRLYYYTKPLGATLAKEWEERVMGFVGDVMGTQLPQAIYLRDDVLTALNEKVRVKKTLDMRVSLENDDSVENFAPRSAREREPNYDEVHTRYAMCVPPKYVPLLLGKRLSPREGFLLLERATRENDEEEAMQPLIDWLRVSLTRGNAAAETPSPVTLPASPSVPMVTPELAERLQRLVKGDLPAWQQTGAPSTTRELPAAQTTQQQQLEQLLLTQLLRQQGAGISGETTKLPSSHFKGTINLLLRLTSKNDESDLPEIYHRWANSNKKEFRAVLQEVFDQNAVLLGLPEPVATADLALTISTLRFASADEDDLEQGLQPFAVAYHSQKTLAEQAALNSLHDLLYMGTPQLTDLWAMKAANKLWIPTKASQLVRTIKSFAVVLATVLGTNSLLYQVYKKQIVDAYDEVSPTLETYAERHPMQPVYAQVLRWLQLRFHDYWRQAQRSTQGPTTVPEFSSLYESIKYKNWIPPEIPAIYMRDSEPSNAVILGTHPSLNNQPSTSGGPPFTPEGKKPTPKIQKNDDVPDSVRALAVNVGKIQKFLEVMGDGRAPPIPKNNRGQEMCLAWFLKGGCYNTCQRKETHAKLNAAEEKRLCEFLKKGIAKQQPSAPAQSE